MKPSVYTILFFFLLLCAWQPVELRANQECAPGFTPQECTLNTDIPLMPSMENPCYAPEWCNAYNITQNSCTWSWASCYGAYSYSVQWCYPGGTWYNLPGVCYENWINMNNLNPCTNYQYRVRANCSGGYYSSWCYPYSFSTLCYNYCETPYGCYTTNITENTANFHWNAIWGAQHYQVQVRPYNGSWYYLPENPCYNNYCTAWNLQPGTYYEWRVRAYCGYNNYSDWTYTNYFTTNKYYYCTPPEWLSCYDITEYSATWKWSGVYGADYYMIQWCTSGGTWYDLAGGPFYGTWVNVNHLSPCTTYQWRVKSYCHYGGWSTWCYPYTFTTTCNSYCPVPTGLITKDIGDTKATFKWSPVYGASSYSVQIKDAWGSWHDVYGSPTTGLWITVGGLSPCKSYEWRVRANCHYESSSYWSKPKQFTTTCGNGCYAPQWVYTNGITTTSATLHWAAVSGADYYVVEWRKSGGTFTEMVGGPWTNPWAELTGLQPTTAYEWRVKSHCSSGYYSDWSSVTYFTTAGYSCGFPMFRYTLPITDSTATFNWSVVSGASNYTVQIRTIGGQWQDVLGSPTTNTSITATGLSPNTEYEWQMQVNCSNGGYSPWTSAIKFSTGSSNGCATPGSLYTDNLTLNSATLHWSTVAGDSNYSVEIRVWPNGAWNPVSGSPVDTNFITVDGLNPFTTYEWRVRANCEGGNHSFWSGGYQFTTTNAPPCNPPTGMQSSAITETTATLSWSPVSGAIGYKVETRLPNGNWIPLPGGIVADTFALATGFTPNTTYEWHVRAQCDSTQYSNWSASATFTTIGSGMPNDECANAILLTVETSCVATFASNVDATASQPPPAGGCNSVNAKDVWFKFTMPDVQNPTVTIRTSAGSLGNAVMEVYSGTDCSILSVIACEDNNDNGNGSSMPVINLTGTPNATIWVRVWGFEGSTGTFTICVFNYVSFNLNEISFEGDDAEGSAVEELEEVVQVATESDVAPGLYVSPNPVNDMLNVMVQQNKDSRVVGWSVVDLSGKVMLTQTVEQVQAGQFRTAVDLSNIVPGMYVLQVRTTSGVMAEKVSVMR